VPELFLSSGPARYFGGSVESFALPYGAIILIGVVLYFIFRRPHNVPRMKYLKPAHQTSVGTREPGTAGMITLRSGSVPASSAVAEADTAVPGGQQPHASETLYQAPADGTADTTDSATEATDGTAGPA
jgi:hypothetical protein